MLTDEPIFTHDDFPWLRAGVVRHARALFPDDWRDRVEVQNITAQLIEDGIGDLSELAPGELDRLILHGGGLHGA